MSVKKIYWFLSSELGFDLRKFLYFFRGIPKYCIDLVKFFNSYSGKLVITPCVSDRYQQGGDIRSEYFKQDLYVAQKIFTANPKSHIDVGSRIDGFVAHVASFRKLKIFDIRPVSTNIPNVVFEQADLMNPPELYSSYCDSLSCLHSLEHFGLGRYGDKIDPYGYIVGFRNMAKILREGGVFYLSVPIGVARVEFNAHRVFNPKEIVELAEENRLLLEDFAWVKSGRITESVNKEKDIDSLGRMDYSLGIFTFRKQAKQVLK